MANWGKILSRGRVEDRRSAKTMAVGGIGAGGIVLLLVLNTLLGGSPADLLNQIEQMPLGIQNSSSSEYEGEDSYEVFASTVLGSNNSFWIKAFSNLGITYTKPSLILFRQATSSGCGFASSQVGPHYCPLDNNIYLDETFFDELVSRFGASGGDVAEAYVISHEVAHHVQNILGITEQVQQDQSNEMSIKLELQADCFAGLWANSIKKENIFEPGEIHEAMDAASAVGDDRIQEKVTGYINPENFTHGSSADRVKWFDTGYTKGDFTACDTFK